MRNYPIVATHSYVAIPNAGTGEVAQTLLHTGSSLSLPEIIVLDADGRNGDPADGSVGEQEVIGQLSEFGEIGQSGQLPTALCAGKNDRAVAAGTDPVAAGTGRSC